MSAKVTKGPYQVIPPEFAEHRWIIADMEGGSIADCSPPGPWMSFAEADANANLLAASWSMAEALEMVLTVWFDATATRADDERAEQAARDALRLAKGE